jgi:hypothetical protein
VHLGLERAPNVSLELVDADAVHAAGCLSDNAVVFHGARPDVDVVQLAAEDRVEELRVLRSASAPSTTRYRLRHGAGVASIRLREGRIEAVDAAGVVRIASEPLVAIDADGTTRSADARLAPLGDGSAMLTVTWDTDGLHYPVVLDPAWSSGNALNVARTRHRVLPFPPFAVVVGGYLTNSPYGYADSLGLTSVEGKDLTARWTVGTSMQSGHADFVATLLDASHALVVGGTNVASAEIGSFHSNGTAWSIDWSPVAPLSKARAGAVASQLAGGRVLVAGPDSTAEVYDGVSWTSAPPMSANREHATATRLADGRVLVVGGFDTVAQKTLSSAEIYDPVTNAWSATGVMANDRVGHAATLLSTGAVLVTGGLYWYEFPRPAHFNELAKVESWSPTTGLWSTLPAMQYARGYHTATLLDRDRVFVVGGAIDEPCAGADACAVSSCEYFDPSTSTWTAGPDLPGGRSHHTAHLEGSTLYVVGGENRSGSGLFDTEILSLSGRGGSCSTDTDCLSGVCANHVCCERPCPGVCDTCASFTGICSTSGARVPPAPPKSCAPYVNCQSGACMTSCAADYDCVATAYCDGTSCKAKGANGNACSDSRACLSGHCADGVCCDTVCTGQCEACDVTGAAGTCLPVKGAPHGARPTCSVDAARYECASACDGLDHEKCGIASVGLVCGASTCAAGTEQHVGICDGKGACLSSPKSCGSYVCGASSCKTSCATTADCAAGNYCTGSTCSSVVGLGLSCAAPTDCKSGYCADGVCCEKSTCGAGGSCATPGFLGICKVTQGGSCTADAGCASQHCVDGVCCDTACVGQCEACAEPGHVGTCSAVNDTPRGSRTPCATGFTNPCNDLVCNGAKSRAVCSGFLHGTNTYCSKQSCANTAAESGRGTCDGDGSCLPGPIAACQHGRTCEPVSGACRVGCAADSECQLGFRCVSGDCNNGAYCSRDRKTAFDSAGKSKDCPTILCNPQTGDCGGTCRNSLDCAPPLKCNSLQQCVAPAASTDVGGCGLRPVGRSEEDGESSRSTHAVLAAATLLSIAARRRGSARSRLSGAARAADTASRT